ncbi:MAG: HNH endonuclease, partial [Oscillospiraceae bacterium]|nr:HNH endonuclease [Oscillospiraceae bacterium]
AIYSGAFITSAKAEFSNSGNANTHEWSAYIKGTALRQDYLATALSWVAASKGQEIDSYMAEHRYDSNITELKNYFTSVIDWVAGVFRDVEKEMCGLEWGRLYEQYHNQSYNPAKVSEAVQRLYGDFYVKSKRGIFEYILGGETDTKLLEVRVFDEAAKQSVYKQQTSQAKSDNNSNCPLCAIGHDSNKAKIWTLKEMDADHVSAWSNGGATDIGNCQMLCRTHNQSKGNK